MSMSKQEKWRLPADARPPEQFWKDFGNFIMASYQYDDTDEYWETLIRWADILQRRYHGNEITGKVILDYVDSQERKLQADPDYPGYKREIA